MLVNPTILSALSATSNAQDIAAGRISSGKKINSAIDDPLAFDRLTATKASVSQTAIKLSTLDLGMQRLDARDSVLGSMQDALMRFQELATMASTGVQPLKDILPEMASIKEALLSMGNTSDASGQLFAGSATSTKPFVKDPVTGAVTYQGNSTENVINVDGVTMSGTLDGGKLMSMFNAVDNVLASVKAGTTPTTAQVGLVAAAVGATVDVRTDGGAQAAGAKVIQNALTASKDRETDLVSDIESADPTQETINYTEAQKHYESILKITGMQLNQRRLMDYL